MSTGVVDMEPLDLDLYPAQREHRPIPPEGTYLVQIDPFTDDSFRHSAKNGSLVVRVTGTIAEGPHEGYPITTYVGSTAFERGDRKVSMLGLYLKACGLSGRLTTEADVIAAVQSTAGRTVKAKLRWEATNRATGFTVKGMDQFPTWPDGTHQPWIEDPQDVAVDATGRILTDEQGRPLKKRLRARLTVSAFYAQE